MAYIVLFLVGFGLAVSGGISLIAYLNFLPAGITWLEYFIFIRTRIECYFLPFGFFLISISLYKIPRINLNKQK